METAQSTESSAPPLLGLPPLFTRTDLRKVCFHANLHLPSVQPWEEGHLHPFLAPHLSARPTTNVNICALNDLVDNGAFAGNLCGDGILAPPASFDEILDVYNSTGNVSSPDTGLAACSISVNETVQGIPGASIVL